MTMAARLLFACGSVALTFVAQVARADMSKAACAKANADGQALQLEGKLSAARGLAPKSSVGHSRVRRASERM